MTPEIKARFDLLQKEIEGLRAYLGHLEEISNNILEYVKHRDTVDF